MEKFVDFWKTLKVSGELLKLESDFQMYKTNSHFENLIKHLNSKHFKMELKKF